MEQVLVYPYSKEYEMVIKSRKSAEANLTRVVSPRGWGLSGGILDNSGERVEIEHDFEEALKACTMVWFVEDGLLRLPIELLLEKLLLTVRNKKKIYYTRYKNAEEREMVEKLLPPRLNAENDYETEVNFTVPGGEYHTLYEFKTPVINVIGLSENADKYKMQLLLKEEFTKLGYKVSVVSSRRDSGIFGMHSMPGFMWGGSISVTDKILQFNHYIKAIEKAEGPELIILGIPGGAFPRNEYRHQYFGEFHFEISRAVSCDCALLCSSFSEYPVSYFEEAEQRIRQMYDMEVGFHTISDKMYDCRDKVTADGTGTYLSVESGMVSDSIREWKKAKENLYDTASEDETKRLVDDIINRLS